MNANEIISFAAGDTYDLVISTNVHSHPIKIGYPKTAPQYMMVRAKGGISDYLYKVIDYVDLNPFDENALAKLETKYQSVKEYIDLRKSSYVFFRAPNKEFESSAYIRITIYPIKNGCRKFRQPLTH